MSRFHRPAALALVLLAVSCDDAAPRPTAPRESALTARPRADLTAVVAPDAVAPNAAVLGNGALQDAVDRIVPTLAPSDAQRALAASLQQTASAVLAADVRTGLDAAARSRDALAALRAADVDSPAELAAVELALDRAASQLVSPGVPVP